MELIFEVCISSYEDAFNLKELNIKRVELNSSLESGGLTPSLGDLKLIKENTNLKVIAMLRKRAGGFYYDNFEFSAMEIDAFNLLNSGADGLAFGFLTKNKKIDVDKCSKIVELCHKFKKEAVFHRAFDIIEDKDEAIKTLIKLHFDRVLTSGGASFAIDGVETLSYLQNKYGNDIEILAASGINHNNIKEIFLKTNIKQFHASLRKIIPDFSNSNEHVDFSNKLINGITKLDIKKVDLILNEMQKSF